MINNIVTIVLLLLLLQCEAIAGFQPAPTFVSRSTTIAPSRPLALPITAQTQTTSSDEDVSATPDSIPLHVPKEKTQQQKKKKPKKKPKFKINTDLIGVERVSSDGLLTEQKKMQEKEQEARSAIQSKLGVSSKRRMKDINNNNNNNGNSGSGKATKKISKKAEKIAQQRNGSVDSTLQAGLSSPGDQDVQVQVVKRGSKQVTIVRGLACPMDERKKMLKVMKGKLGGGGVMVEGVLELQGSHGERILKLLREKGFVLANIVK